jgi:hypothetical protein
MDVCKVTPLSVGVISTVATRFYGAEDEDLEACLYYPTQ